MSRYGIHSRRMLTFLNENPGANSAEIKERLKILDSRTSLAGRSRGRFAYLLSPYCSRTLSADTVGSQPHPSVANRDSQRMWFYRMKGPDCRGEVGKGRFIYFITLRGMAALEEYGV